MSDCPACGADRLKGAPLILVSAAVRAFTARRRYRCGVCAWTGWRLRLRRRGAIGTSLGTRADDTAPAILFFMLVVASLVTFGALTMNSCATFGPGDTRDVGTLTPPALHSVSAGRSL